jgi:hypothetical protein
MVPHGQKSHQKEFSRWDCFSSRNQVPNKFKRLRRMDQKATRQAHDVQSMLFDWNSVDLSELYALMEATNG